MDIFAKQQWLYLVVLLVLSCVVAAEMVVCVSMCLWFHRLHVAAFKVPCDASGQLWLCPCCLFHSVV
jgi:hypothetical protein